MYNPELLFTEVGDGIITEAIDHDFVQVIIHGNMGSGKTTLANTLTKYVHDGLRKTCGLDYDVVYGGKNEFTDLRDTLENTTGNVILVLDDMSYLRSTMGKRKYQHALGEYTGIRHYTENVIVFVVGTYDYSLPAMMYGNSWGIIYTSLNIAEVRTKQYAALRRRIPKEYLHSVEEFAKEYEAARRSNEFSYERDYVTVHYDWRDPFSFAMLVGQTRDKPRFFIYPKYEWWDDTINGEYEWDEIIDESKESYRE